MWGLWLAVCGVWCDVILLIDTVWTCWCGICVVLWFVVCFVFLNDLVCWYLFVGFDWFADCCVGDLRFCCWWCIRFGFVECALVWILLVCSLQIGLLWFELLLACVEGYWIWLLGLIVLYISLDVVVDRFDVLCCIVCVAVVRFICLRCLFVLIL